MNSNEINVKEVSKYFGTQKVLSNITGVFEAGKIHGIVGNNGSGKSVFFKCIAGILIAEEGEIVVQGKKIGKEVDFPCSLGMIIESPGFLPELSALKNLCLLASLKGIASKETITKAIKDVGLNPMDKKSVGKYSLGMKQRLAIAQATMENPKLLILDEPFNGLDKTGLKEMRVLIKDFLDDEKVILIASHNQEDIDGLCHNVFEMELGVLTKIK